MFSVRSLRCAILTGLSYVRKIKTRRPSRPPSNPRLRFRPGVEVCEAREVPATFFWHGDRSGGYPGDPANWGLSETNPYLRATVHPSSGDDLVFKGTVSNLGCLNLGFGTSSYNSILIANGYTGTVNTSNALTFHSFTLAAPGTYNPSADQTVDTAFSWTQGTLGGPGRVMRLTGGTAAVTPGAGNTLTSGMGFSFEGSVAGTVSTGTLRFASAKSILAVGSSVVNLTNLTITSAVATNEPIKARGASSAPKVITEKLTATQHGLVVEDFGTAKVVGGGTVKFGPVGAAGGPAVTASGGYLAVESGTTLDAGTNTVQITNSRLSTITKAGVNPQTATITTELLTVQQVGDGGRSSIHIGDAIYAEDSGDFGRLFVNGSITWTGGTYHPTVNIDDPAKAYYILEAGNGFQKFNAITSVLPTITGAGWERDAATMGWGEKEWKIKKVS
jgi:hypothetical protein